MHANTFTCHHPAQLQCQERTTGEKTAGTGKKWHHRAQWWHLEEFACCYRRLCLRCCQEWKLPPVWNVRQQQCDITKTNFRGPFIMSSVTSATSNLSICLVDRRLLTFHWKDWNTGYIENQPPTLYLTVWGFLSVSWWEHIYSTHRNFFPH